MYYLLMYDYCENAVERRGPYRESHLKLARAAADRGELLMAGAFADPVDGAVFVFRTAEASPIEGFVRNDPYVANGIVTAWRIRAWTVGVGGVPECGT
ncbi:MAG: YciI-like protein [Bacteroidota bacterium]